MTEWRAIAGYEGIYEVSDDAQVRRISTAQGGRIKILRLRITSTGRQAVVLHRDGIRSDLLVHRLMAIAFIPNPENLPVVRHLDDVPLNNTLSNLAWGSHSDNSFDCLRNGHNTMANKTTCKNGHPFDRTYERNGRTYRYCITCKRAMWLRTYYRAKAKRQEVVS